MAISDLLARLAREEVSHVTRHRREVSEKLPLTSSVSPGGYPVTRYTPLDEWGTQDVRVPAWSREAFGREQVRKAFDAMNPLFSGRPTISAVRRGICERCEHQSRSRTCLEPVKAGLADKFEVVFCRTVVADECLGFEGATR